jgi:MATE family multidrug resistance protein
MTAVAIPAPGSLPLATHIRETLTLALPVMASRCGLVIMMVIDTIMTGRAGGGSELAYYAIAQSPQLTMYAVGVGLLVGTTVLCAQADGAGRPDECGRIWRLSLLTALVLGLLYAALQSLGSGLLALFGQEPRIAAGGGEVLRMFAFGMPPLMMYVATSSFLEGIHRPRPGMIIVLSANLLDVGLNWLLIGGNLGLPAMGAAGAALSTSITRWVMFLAILIYALRMPGRERYGVHAPMRGHYGRMRKLLLIGLPLALAIGFESTCFSTVANFAGWLGEAPLAAYQIGMNVTALVYMLAIGMSTAAAVRVANAVGRNDQLAMARAGWTGVGLILLLMGIAAVLIVLAGTGIVAIYTADAAVVALTIPALAVVAIVTLADGTQGVLIGALRGTGDIIVPTAMYAVSFWAIGVPLAYWLGVAEGGGVRSLFWALFAALAAAALLLALRFHAVSRRLVEPL